MKIIERETFLESLEYDLVASEILRMIPTVNTNGRFVKSQIQNTEKCKPKQLFQKVETNQNLKQSLLLKLY